MNSTAALARRHPWLCFFLIVAVSNAVGSAFNISYNWLLIVEPYLDDRQQDVFRHVVLPVYNLLAYPICLGTGLYLLAPVIRCRRDLRAGRPVTPARLELCRRRLIYMPVHAARLTFLGWMPGAVLFPLLICWLGGTHEAAAIWMQFGASFTVSALLTTAQTFFLLEPFLIHVVYPDFFQDARPADVLGAVRMTFGWRLVMLWLAVAGAPLGALLVVTLNTIARPDDLEQLQDFAVAVAVVGSAFGGLIFAVVGRDVVSWLQVHTAATERIALEDFDVRIPDKRPDEWGRLSDHFNDMALRLGRARLLRETFGQFVSPEVRDEMLHHDPGLGGEVREVTVLFADIRRFTQRCAGERPEHVVALLNGFLTLAVTAVEGKGGLVNKFLGDGFMALFGAPRPRADHADLAVAAAIDLLNGLEGLNHELAEQGQAPLRVGIGIHTGPALVGCLGATLLVQGGRERKRREYTALGETVNLCQRLEQLTKTCGGPVLLSDQARLRLGRPVPLTCLGPQTVPGIAEPLVVYTINEKR